MLAANAGQAEPLDGARALLICLGIAGLLLLVSRPLVRSWAQAAVLASVSVLPVLSYGQMYQAAKNVVILGFTLGRHRILLPLWGLVLLAALWALRRSSREVPSLTQILNVVAVAAVALPLGQLGFHALQTRSLQQAASSENRTSPQLAGGATLAVPDGTQPPDIYYIILDTYARADVLDSQLEFDSTPFLDSLRDLGFYVADCSRSNYANTSFSLASSLNLQYLDTVAPEQVAARASYYDWTPFVRDNAVTAYLRALGYRTIALESGYTPTELLEADSYLGVGYSLQSRLLGGVNSFEVMMLRSSVGLFLYAMERDDLPYWLQLTLYDQAYLEHRDRILFELSELEALGRQAGPKFVFVHILAPHDPFVLGPDGEFVIRDYPFALNEDLENRTWSDYSQGYVGQVTYLNRRLLEIVQSILRESPTPPVIILQGDHGIPRMKDPSERTAILNAYYLPDGGEGRLHSTISPVNSFRVVFNTFLGGTFPLLDDTVNVAASPDDWYNFIHPPDESAACRGN